MLVCNALGMDQSEDSLYVQLPFVTLHTGLRGVVLHPSHHILPHGNASFLADAKGDVVTLVIVAGKLPLPMQGEWNDGVDALKKTILLQFSGVHSCQISGNLRMFPVFYGVDDVACTLSVMVKH